MLSWFRELVRPDAPEPLPVSHLRRGVLIMLIVAPSVLLMNGVFVWVHRHDAGFATWPGPLSAAVNLGCHALSTITCAWLWRRGHDEPTLRRGMVVPFLALSIASWFSLWAVGVPRLLGPTMLAIAYVRLFYNGWLGFLAFVVASVLHVGLLVLVAAGVLPRFGLAADEVGSPLACFQVAGRMAASYAVVWIMTSLVANRYRRSENALRLAIEARERLRLASELSTTPRVGRLSGRTLAGVYELHEVLGAGGMGEVYQGLRLTDGAAVAVKVLRSHHVSDTNMLERFRREAELVGRLSARHVPALLEHGEHEGIHYLVMELLRGEDLGACFRRRGVLPPGELLAVLGPLAEALDAAHALGIVHRDLKPQNVFLEADGGVKLLDFGIARLFEGELAALTQVAVLGTPGFLAPEQARGERTRIGPATDVFALAALAYRGLTGRHAFPARELAGAVHESLFLQPVPATRLVAGLPADVDDVLALGLAKAPEDRHACAGLFVVELGAALAGGLPASRRARARALSDAAARVTLADEAASVTA